MCRRLAAWWMMVCLLVSCAYAAPQTPYPAGTMLAYHQQTPAVQRIVDVLYDAAVRCETVAVLPAGSQYNDAAQAVHVLLSEFPELWHVENQTSIAYYVEKPEEALSVTMSYTMSGAEYDAAAAALLHTAQTIAGAAPDEPYDAALFLHDTLAAWTAYAPSVADPVVYTAYGALMNSLAVCEGYAQALALLYRLKGIPSCMVTGMADGGAHAWNAVLIHGELLQTDCTYNDQDASDVLLHWYFNLPAEDMALTHRTDMVFPFSTSAEWIYPKQTGAYLADHAALEDFWSRLPNLEEVMEVRTADDALYQDLLQALRTNAPIELTVFSNNELNTLTIVP